MDFVYITVYRFEGISLADLDADKLIYEDVSQRVSVLITADVNRHCLQIDQGAACAGLIFRGMFSEDKKSELLPELQSAIERIQSHRTNKNKHGAYVVITIKGQIEANISEELRRETSGFDICFDAIDKDAFDISQRDTINQVLCSLAIYSNPAYHAEKIASGMYLIDARNKPLYSFTLRAGVPRFIVARPISESDSAEISQFTGLCIKQSELRTPFRLLAQSIETTDDKLRAFTSAWSALEILINKAFLVYEDEFVNTALANNGGNGVSAFIQRIQDVMKDKYRLTDKFALTASYLSDNVDADIDLFKTLKKQRDAISHGQEFDEESLPVEDARRLTGRFLRNHILRNARRSSSGDGQMDASSGDSAAWQGRTF
jgi:hypothetical protein